MRPFWSAHLSNLIHVFCWRCILPFVGVIADLRFLTSVPESGRAYLPPTQLGVILIYTPSVPYRTIHSVALSLYPTRYLVHPFGTNDSTAVLSKAPFVLCIHALPAPFVLRLHLDFSPSQRSRDRLSLSELHRYYPSSLICPLCCCCHQHPLISTTILSYIMFAACCLE